MDFVVILRPKAEESHRRLAFIYRRSFAFAQDDFKRVSPKNNQAAVNLVSGQITSLSSGKLFIKDTNGALRELHAGDKLNLGDSIFADRGTKASIKLSTPKRVPDDSDLVFIQPLPDQQYEVNVKIKHDGDDSVDVSVNS